MIRATHPTFPFISAFLGPIVYWAFFGFDLRWFIASLIAVFLFDSLGVQLGVHKLLSHRSFQTTRAVRNTLAGLSLFSGQGSPIFWVAVHMGAHHPHADGDKDVHGPHLGLFHAFMSWYWTVDAKKVSFLPAREYLRDQTLVFMHKHHYFILLGYWLVLGAVGFVTGAGLAPLVYLGLLPVACSLTLVGLVNAFLHSDGAITRVLFCKYRNHPDVPGYNSVVLGVLTMGLGLHNNHHKHPQSLHATERWFEIDASKWIVPLLRSSKMNCTHSAV